MEDRKSLDPTAIPNLSFFHGTSSVFARNVLGHASGIPFPRDESIKLAATLFDLCMSHVSNWLELATFFDAAGCTNSIAAPLALRNIAQGTQGSLIEYGAFYVTLNPEIAASYAVNSRYGSEVLTLAGEAMEALRFHGDARVANLETDFPAATGIICMSHEPVVLRMTGFHLADLANENGDNDPKQVLDRIGHALNFITLGVRDPAAFRVPSVRTEQIQAIYPLDRVEKPFVRDEFAKREIAVQNWSAQAS